MTSKTAVWGRFKVFDRLAIPLSIACGGGKCNFGEDGVFESFEVDGTKASYRLDDSTIILVDVSQVLGKTAQGSAEKQVTRFSGGPGEAGWPDSTTDYTCVTAAN